MVVSLYSGTVVVWNHETQVSIDRLHIPPVSPITCVTTQSACTVNIGFNPVCVQTMVKTFEVCDLPVRVAKFIARKHWVITGAVSTGALM